MAKNLSNLLSQISSPENHLAHFLLMNNEQTNVSIARKTAHYGEQETNSDTASMILSSDPTSDQAPNLWEAYVNGYCTIPGQQECKELSALPIANSLSLYLLSEKLQQTDPATGLYVLTRLSQVITANDLEPDSFTMDLPMLPIDAFCFVLGWSKIAWIPGTLEAIIAAPFLMMTLVLPGGHHFAGHSIPGLRILLGIIFRPCLWFWVYLVGLVPIYIVIIFSADAFHVVAITLIGGKMNGTNVTGIIPNTAQYTETRGIIACLMLFLYCSFLMLAFQKCFSPIYLKKLPK